jgi:predicted deacylase
MKSQLEALLAVAAERCELVIRADELVAAVYRINREATTPGSETDVATQRALGVAERQVLADAVEAVLMLHTARMEIARAATEEARREVGLKAVECRHSASQREADRWKCNDCGAEMMDTSPGWVRP